MNIRVEALGLKKVFNRRVIFQNISFALTMGQALLVTGRNGSGKSTLMKIISNVLTPTAGTVNVITDASTPGRVPLDDIGLVSPYLMMYDEFSARENLEFAMRLRGRRPVTDEIDVLLEIVGLHNRRHDLVRTYSSGMKQRLKYAFALVHRPAALLLDEPMSNLDSDGVAIVRGIMREQRATGILIVATNDLSDMDSYDILVDLNEQR